MSHDGIRQQVLAYLLRFCESLFGFPWNTTDFPALYHLAGRRFDFELLSGLILCCLFRCSQNLKFLLDFYCYNVNNRVKHASQACFSRTHA